MTEQHLLETIDDGVATLTMNRPESLNALSPDMMERFVLPADVAELWETDPGAAAHRLVLARSPQQRLRPVEGLRFMAVSQRREPVLADFGAPVSSWSAGVRVGHPPESRSRWRRGSRLRGCHRSRTGAGARTRPTGSRAR